MISPYLNEDKQNWQIGREQVGGVGRVEGSNDVPFEQRFPVQREQAVLDRLPHVVR